MGRRSWRGRGQPVDARADDGREPELRKIVESMADALVVMDEKGAIADWNPASERLFGWSRAEVLGRTVAEVLVPPDLRESHVAALGRFFRTGERTFTRPVELPALQRDGSRVTVELTLTGLRTDDRWRVYGFLRDVSARKRAEEAQRESEERLRQLAESVDTVFMLRSVDPFEYLYVSPAVERVFGIPAERIYRDPLSVFALIHPDDLPSVRAISQELAEHPQADIEYRFLRPDGTTRWFHAKVAPARVENGRVTRLATTVEDVTERRQAESALRAARADAERANHAKSEFLSRMSHELRTPLNAIIGFGQLLSLEDLTPDQQEATKHILNAGRLLLDLINEVLDIARVESGRLQMSVELVRLADVVGEALDLVRPLTAVRDVRLPESVPDELDVYVHADRQRLKQVMLNLLANAVKYNRDGGEVRLGCVRLPDGVTRLSVTDTGIGIAEHQLGLLFTPFERLDADQTQVEGTGLGLALTRLLVEAMGGSVGAESEVGRGSSFWVQLRSGDGDRVTLPAPDIQLPQQERPAPAGTVLYIEDNITNVRLLERILARLPDIDLIVATDGTSGLEMAKEHRPALILLDLHLPDIPGEEVLARVRAEPALRSTPVVIITADATFGKAEQVSASGADDYLTKPLDVQNLIVTIDRHLQGRGREDATRHLTDDAGHQPR